MNEASPRGFPKVAYISGSCRQKPQKPQPQPARLHVSAQQPSKSTKASITFQQGSKNGTSRLLEKYTAWVFSESSSRARLREVKSSARLTWL